MEALVASGVGADLGPSLVAIRRIVQALMGCGDHHPAISACLDLLSVLSKERLTILWVLDDAAEDYARRPRMIARRTLAMLTAERLERVVGMRPGIATVAAALNTNGQCSRPRDNQVAKSIMARWTTGRIVEEGCAANITELVLDDHVQTRLSPRILCPTHHFCSCRAVPPTSAARTV